MATETQTTIQREAPEIEAYKIGLMEQAKGLTGRPPIGGLPDIRSAGMTLHNFKHYDYNKEELVRTNLI
jgi:hypothetical protein